jgi:agmatine/peptidylarginine deiminase
MWVRDYGPRILRHGGGGTSLLDSRYGGAKDDRGVSQRMARQLQLPRICRPLYIDGGNVLTNGNGLFISTEQLLTGHAAPEALWSAVGVGQFVVLEPLDGEPTGHVDMFATFPSGDTVVLGRIDPGTDPVNSGILDRNAEALARLVTPEGPLRVVRVPMGPRHDGIWRSYTNVVYANGTLLVPVFPEAAPAESSAVLRLYAELLPSWNVVAVPTEKIARLGGGPHCVTCNLATAGPPPRFYDRPLDDNARKLWCGLAFMGCGLVARHARRTRRAVRFSSSGFRAEHGGTVEVRR